MVVIIIKTNIDNYEYKQLYIYNYFFTNNFTEKLLVTDLPLIK